MLFIIGEAKESILNFSQLWEIVGVQWIYFALTKYQYKMTLYNSLNVKLSNSKLNNLKPRIKNGTEVTLNLSSNVFCDSNDETNFPHELLSTDRQVSRFCKALVNNSSANIKFSKAQISEIVQSKGIFWWTGW